MPTPSNLYEALPKNTDKEHFELLAKSTNCHIERIVSYGQSTPPGDWYDQDHAEWVILLSGNASLEYEDGSVAILNPGDYIQIPAHQKHRVAKTSSPAIWLAVHFS